MLPQMCSYSWGILSGVTAWDSSFKLIVATRYFPRSRTGYGLLTYHSYAVGDFPRTSRPMDTIVSHRISSSKPCHHATQRMKLKAKSRSGSALESGLCG